MRLNTYRYRVILSAFVLLTAGTAHAGLQVVPIRIDLSDNQKVAAISLKHIGKSTGQYRISLIFNRMKKDGSMEEVKDIQPDERDASKYIRFSPQVAVLQPNVEQVAKVMVVAPKNLAEGEYRTHLLFEPTEETEGEEMGGGKKTSEKGAIGMSLTAKMSVAVPVFYKHGSPTFQTQLTNLKLVRMPDGSLGYDVTMLSEGNAFPRGDFEVYFTPHGKEPVQVSLVRSVPSYLKERSFSTALTPPQGIKLAKGLLRVEYRQAEEGGVKGKLIHSIDGNIP